MSAGAGAALAERLYPREVVETLPAAAITWALGVGDLVAAVDLAPGEVGDQPIGPGDAFSIAPREPHAIASEPEQPLWFVCMGCLFD